jgi:hypothetical protein
MQAIYISSPTSTLVQKKPYLGPLLTVTAYLVPSPKNKRNEMFSYTVPNQCAVQRIDIFKLAAGSMSSSSSMFFLLLNFTLTI